MDEPFYPWRLPIGPVEKKSALRLVVASWEVSVYSILQLYFSWEFFRPHPRVSGGGGGYFLLYSCNRCSQRILGDLGKKRSTCRRHRKTSEILMTPCGPNMSFCFPRLISFHEDDILSFLLGSLNILWLKVSYHPAYPWTISNLVANKSPYSATEHDHLTILWENLGF